VRAANSIFYLQKFLVPLWLGLRSEGHERWKGRGSHPLSIWPPARHNLCHRYTRTRPRFCIQYVGVGPSIHLFQFLQLGCHSSRTLFPLVFPRFFLRFPPAFPDLPAALVMRFKARHWLSYRWRFFVRFTITFYKICINTFIEI